MQPILMRGYYSIQNTLKPVLLGTMTTAVFVLLAYLLQSTTLGYLGLPLASSLSAIFLAVVMLKNLAKDAGTLEIKNILLTLAKAIFASSLIAIIMYVGFKFLPDGIGLSQNVWAVLKLVILGLGSMWIYYALTKKLNMPESEYFDRLVKRLNFKDRVRNSGQNG